MKLQMKTENSLYEKIEPCRRGGLLEKMKNQYFSVQCRICAPPESQRAEKSRKKENKSLISALESGFVELYNLTILCESAKDLLKSEQVWNDLLNQ